MTLATRPHLPSRDNWIILRFDHLKIPINSNDLIVSWLGDDRRDRDPLSSSFFLSLFLLRSFSLTLAPFENNAIILGPRWQTRYNAVELINRPVCPEKTPGRYLEWNSIRCPLVLRRIEFSRLIPLSSPLSIRARLLIYLTLPFRSVGRHFTLSFLFLLCTFSSFFPLFFSFSLRSSFSLSTVESAYENESI